MGIKDLCQFLKKNYQDINLKVPIKRFYGERIAIDTSVYLYKFICIHNQNKGNWLDMFINFILFLRKNNIRPLFVFDGTPPKEKEKTQNDRRANRSKIESTIDKIQSIINELEDTVGVPNHLEDDIKDILNDNDILNSSKRVILSELYKKQKKENSKCIKIGAEENKKIRELLTLWGIPWIQATGEAERTCSWLCKWGHVAGVLTTDSDCLVYGAPVYIYDLKLNDAECNIFRYEDILSEMEISPNEFRDFCIMCGTDYNGRIPGIGSMSAFSLIKQYKSIDVLREKGYNTNILNYERVRELFELPGKEEWDKVILDNEIKDLPFIKQNPDIGALTLFLFKNNSVFKPEELLIGETNNFIII